MSASSTTQAVTTAGIVEGERLPEAGLVFRGIPYAAPPVGELHFAEPQPPVPWEGVRPAREFGPTSAQAPSTGEAARLLPNTIIPGEDILNLNVWTPGLGGRAPVLVFIHGGSFTSGSGAVPGYDGRRFARDGVVVVTINYRLGAHGFLWFGEGPANLGLLDQIQALRWVRENIAAFGGDPASVTVCGESAGAMSVGCLLAMPAAAGLFQRAILQSGAAHHAVSPATARKIGTRLAALLGVEPTREAIAALPIDTVVAAQVALAKEVSARPSPRRWGEVARNIMPFEPVVDGMVLPEFPINAIGAGASAGVQLLVGTNAEETRLFLVPTGIIRKVPGFFVGLKAHAYGLGIAGARRYRRNRLDALPGDALSAIMTDWMYRIPALRLAEARPGTHVYEFAWRSPAYDGQLGACHALELAFVFDLLDEPGYDGLTGGSAPQSLADTVHAAWVGFICTGDPGWPAYDTTTRTEMRFDAVSATINDSRGDEREMWDRR